jgi:hypothetical protein
LRDLIADVGAKAVIPSLDTATLTAFIERQVTAGEGDDAGKLLAGSIPVLGLAAAAGRQSADACPLPARERPSARRAPADQVGNRWRRETAYHLSMVSAALNARAAWDYPNAAL